MKIWRFKDGHCTCFVFAEDLTDARAVLRENVLGDAPDEEVDDFEATELTESEADTIHVVDEDTGRTTLGAIFRDAPERGYACGTEL